MQLDASLGFFRKVSEVHYYLCRNSKSEESITVEYEEPSVNGINRAAFSFRRKLVMDGLDEERTVHFWRRVGHEDFLGWIQTSVDFEILAKKIEAEWMASLGSMAGRDSKAADVNWTFYGLDPGEEHDEG